MSVVAALATTIPACILEAVLGRLLPLFLPSTGGDTTAARAAADQMLAAYQPRTEDELCLAATIVGFTLQALDAIGQAASQEVPLTRVLRLRSGAVSLSREADKARRALTQMQKNRQPAQPAAAEAEPQAAAAPETAAAPPAQPVAARYPGRPQTEADRQQDLRIAESIKRATARASGGPAAQMPVPPAVTNQWAVAQPV